MCGCCYCPRCLARQLDQGPEGDCRELEVWICKLIRGGGYVGVIINPLSIQVGERGGGTAGGRRDGRRSLGKLGCGKGRGSEGEEVGTQKHALCD